MWFGASFAGLVLLACSHAPPPPLTSLDREPPRLVSAFFGLDQALPTEAVLMCRQAPGLDGMPVTFSRRVQGNIDPAAFTVRLRSGAVTHPVCATTKPADATAKNHTVLLIGDLGSAANDPPESVEVTGSLALAGGADGKGLTGPVTPLPAGPTLVLATAAAPGTIASDCPDRVRQIIVAIWAGGVKPGPEADHAAHLAGYRVDTTAGVFKPFALGDLGDRDNYVHLCLDTDAQPIRVGFDSGLLVDPNGDPNPETSIAISRRE